MIDGVDTTDPVTGLFGLDLAYEAVESVEVMTAGRPPELGRVSGAVIQVVTRSGDASPELSKPEQNREFDDLSVLQGEEMVDMTEIWFHQDLLVAGPGKGIKLIAHQ